MRVTVAAPAKRTSARRRLRMPDTTKAAATFRCAMACSRARRKSSPGLEAQRQQGGIGIEVGVGSWAGADMPRIEPRKVDEASRKIEDAPQSNQLQEKQTC